MGKGGTLAQARLRTSMGHQAFPLQTQAPPWKPKGRQAIPERATPLFRDSGGRGTSRGLSSSHLARLVVAWALMNGCMSACLGVIRRSGSRLRHFSRRSASAAVRRLSPPCAARTSAKDLVFNLVVLRTRRVGFLVIGSSSREEKSSSVSPSKWFSENAPLRSIFFENGPLKLIMSLSISLFVRPGKRILPVNSSYSTQPTLHMSSAWS
mmetsp:Transcript_4676/g.11334  ORF Transcript_4676/g.11334 Transcript_4676/m.11334 type:complete len:209 (+) Transcript_4676:1283-1909(+)